MTALATPTVSADESRYEQLPAELKALTRFCVWRTEPADGGRPTKVPYNVRRPRWKAASNKPETWATFADAIDLIGRGGFDGLGFMLSQGPDGLEFSGLDLDHSLTDAGTAQQWAAPFVEQACTTYGEISPSGLGVKFIARGAVPGGTRKTCDRLGLSDDPEAAIEVYGPTSARFFTITGDRWPDAAPAVVDAAELFTSFYRMLKPDPKPTPAAQDAKQAAPHFGTDDEVLAVALRSSVGGKFGRLFDGSDGGNRSSGDQALCNYLAFFTGHDRDQTDRLFRASSRMRDKWDEKHSADGRTYGQMTVDKAMADVQGNYDPDHGRDDPEAAIGAGGGVETAADDVMRALFPSPPLSLDDRDPAPIPAGVVRGGVGDMIDAVAASTETPAELGVMFAFGALATAAQPRFVVEVEPGYREPLAFWGLCPLPPGSRKTAVMSEIRAPLAKWEQAQAEAMAPKIRDAESKQKTLKARLDALRAKAAKANAAEFNLLLAEIAELEAEMPQVPTVPRVLAEDVTPEHCGTLMSQNGGCIAILSDEGGPFENLAGRYANGVANLDLALKGYSRSPVRVDRGSRPSVSIEHPALTLVVSPQPCVVEGLAEKSGFKGRGLIDRPLYFWCRSTVGYRSLVPCPVPADVRAGYERIVSDLLDVIPGADDGCHVLRLEPDAHATWKAFQRDVETELRDGRRLGNLKGWGGKLPGNCARVAALIHLAEKSYQAVSMTTIDADTMGRAVALCRVLIDHAIAMFGQMGAHPDVEAARRLWGVIEQARRPRITARNAWHPLRGTYKRLEDVEGGFQVLADHNLIAEPRPSDLMPRGRGRPSRVLIVHPDIVRGWQS